MSLPTVVNGRVTVSEGGVESALCEDSEDISSWDRNPNVERRERSF